MPAKIERSIKRSVRKAHPRASARQVAAETFAILNKQGYVRGNVETAKGRAAERKYELDHSEG